MPKESTKALLKFLKPFPPDTIKTALWLRDFVWDLYPHCNELIYDNYNAVAFGWGLSDKAGDVFISIAVGGSGKGVNFGFNRGIELADPKGILKGEGNQWRSIKIFTIDDFPKAYMKKLLKEAHKNSVTGFKEKEQVLKGATLVKSISARKRRPPEF
jgi:Domain of unknown function (DU1801)